MQLGVHPTFPGTCEAAFRFYEGVLGGKPGFMQTYGQSPGAEQLAPEWRAKIIHGSISIDGRELFGADVRVDEYQQPQGFYLLIDIAGLANAERIFAVLAENGSVKLPLRKTFWSPGFGVVVDRFGVSWEVSCESASAT